jgi:DNA-binding NarL/FixJ family response regulator
MRLIRIVIAEDSLLMRAGVNALLDAEDDLEVVDLCAYYDDLIRAVDRQRPDVVVTDIRMPPTSTDEGVRAATALRTTHPEVGVVLLSQFLDSAYLLALVAEGRGRRAYLLKEQVAGPGELTAAVRIVAGGGSFIDPLVVDSLVDTESRRDRSPLNRLTARELETLRELANGKSNQAIAAGFNVSERAVEKHVGAIFTKLDLPDDRDTNRRVKAVLMFLNQPA